MGVQVPPPTQAADQPIRRLPRSNTYVVISDGVRYAVFYTKVGNRLLGSSIAADHPPAALELRRALHTIDRSINDAIHATASTPPHDQTCLKGRARETPGSLCRARILRGLALASGRRMLVCHVR